MNTRRNRVASLQFAAALAAVVVTGQLAAPARAQRLWTEPQKNRSAVAIPSAAPLVRKVEPAVLVVFTESDQAPQLPPGHPPIGPDAMPFPPGMGPEGDPRGMRGQGAGFIVTPDGYALTNHHVIEDATRIFVFVGEDRTEVPAVVVGSDEKTDVALLKLQGDRKDWPVIPFGDSDTLAVGDFLVAIGTPFGLEQSVSLGILSGRGRRDIAPSGRAGLYDFLQTDASINPGNSGGPLLNLYGEVVGMNAAVNAAGSGIGFAIPINMVKRLLPSLKEKGRFERSWIGVAIQPVTPELVKGLGVDGPRGALVREVVEDGPAAKAGVEPGDVIVAFEGRRIKDSFELPLLAGDAGAGTSVKLEVLRDGKPRTLPVVLGAHPDNAAAAAAAASKDVLKPPPAAPDKEASLGVTVVSLDADDRDRLRMGKSGKGTRITKVRPGSAAFQAGLAVDDVVLTVDGQLVPTANDFAAAVKAAAPGALLKLRVFRQGSILFVPLIKP